MQKLFTLLFNSDPLYQRIIDINSESFKSFDFELITKQFVDPSMYGSDVRSASDIERIYHLKNDTSKWYMDADTLIDKLPDFELEEGFPYLYYGGGIYDICVMLGNGCQWFFDMLYERFDSKNPIRWYQPILNKEFKDKIKPIPEGYFRHLALHIPKIHAKECGMVATYDFSLEYKNNEFDIKIRGIDY